MVAADIAFSAHTPDEAQDLAEQSGQDEYRNGALKAQSFPGVDKIPEVADRSFVLLQHELDQLLKHARDRD